MTDITRDDIEEFFTQYQSDIVPGDRDALDGFVEWAHDVAQKTAEEIECGDDEILAEICYTYRQRDENRGADTDAVVAAAGEFVYDYRDELVEALREVA